PGNQGCQRRISSRPSLETKNWSGWPGADGFTALPTFQVFRKVQSGGVTLCGVLLETLEADRRQVAIHRRIQQSGVRRVLFHHPPENLDRPIPFERWASGQQLVKNGAETVNIHRT